MISSRSIYNGIWQSHREWYQAELYRMVSGGALENGIRQSCREYDHTAV